MHIQWGGPTPNPYLASDPWNGDASKSLRLNGIIYTGQVGGSIAMPEVTFTGVAMANRHNANAGFPALYKWRVAAVNNETGRRAAVRAGTVIIPSRCGGRPPTHKEIDDFLGGWGYGFAASGFSGSFAAAGSVGKNWFATEYGVMSGPTWPAGPPIEFSVSAGYVSEIMRPW